MERKVAAPLAEKREEDAARQAEKNDAKGKYNGLLRDAKRHSPFVKATLTAGSVALLGFEATAAILGTVWFARGIIRKLSDVWNDNHKKLKDMKRE